MIHNPEAERAVLACCLLVPSFAEIANIEDGLNPAHFAGEAESATYAAMLRAVDEGAGVDELTVAERLHGVRLPEGMGPGRWMDLLTGFAPTLAHSRTYVGQVIKAWRWEQRRQAQIAAAAAIDARDEDAYLVAEQSADRLVTDQKATHFTDPDALANHMADWLDQPAERGLPVPWPQLAQLLVMRPGHTTVLSSYTNIGKSHVAGQILATVGAAGGRAVVWTNEMSQEEYVARQLTRETGVSFEDIMSRAVAARDLKRVTDALPHLGFGVVEAHGWPVEQIARHMRQVKPDIAVVDHFHALPGIAKTDGADHAVQALVAGAARAACHLLLVCQLNQARNLNPPRPAPVLRDLRSTGSLSSLPNNVLFLHREDEEDGGRWAAGLTGHLEVAKQRGGPLGQVSVHFVERRLQFVEETRLEAVA